MTIVTVVIQIVVNCSRNACFELIHRLHRHPYRHSEVTIVTIVTPIVTSVSIRLLTIVTIAAIVTSHSLRAKWSFRAKSGNFKYRADLPLCPYLGLV
jgi:hypothetical protein